ncbi:biopolymer transport protein ExbD [Algoriphagus ratkowskyi]|uniref:Biopolymer transport protein ExbD n=1 Tax=Algoriphagus ratkowskyi TaxID=57028 RepID=A0A2W7RA74_9BACT|nr:biopolymer transporter ExbD [Algoriphagus ratkowskyi]PZX56046.1 biopolymer transport protein ExbD [Algoriphagus ratkowskyi]TXD77147.1 biopolymer transporter ExbD [Algoriphagus ratkowskyi]
MARKKNRMSTEVNAGSMADIAFLLLIFFLVTTTIASDKGILNVLPPKLDPLNPPPEIDLNERNIFVIRINSNDQYLIEGDYRDNTDGLDEELKAFIMNFGSPDEASVALYNSLPASVKALAGRNPESSDDPGDAVISIKTDRGTSYEKYLEVFDLAKKAYFDIYAARVNLSTDEYRALTGKNDAEESLIDRGKEGIPMAISIAEPDKIGGN